MNKWNHKKNIVQENMESFNIEENMKSRNFQEKNILESENQSLIEEYLELLNIGKNVTESVHVVERLNWKDKTKNLIFRRHWENIRVAPIAVLLPTPIFMSEVLISTYTKVIMDVSE